MGSGVECQLLRRGGRAGRATRNAGDSVAKCPERTATVCNVGLQIMQEMECLRKLLIERSDPVTGRGVFLQAMQEIKQSSLKF